MADVRVIESKHKTRWRMEAALSTQPAGEMLSDRSLLSPLASLVKVLEAFIRRLCPPWLQSTSCSVRSWRAIGGRSSR